MKTLRRPIFWFATAMWLLSIVLAALFIQLGSLVMSDIPTAEKRLSVADFVNSTQLETTDSRIENQQKLLKQNKFEIEDAQFRLNSLKLDYNTKRAHFESWIKTRSVTASSAENPEVFKRVKVLEKIKEEEREAGRALEALEQNKIQINRVINVLRANRQQILTDAQTPYEKAKQAEILKVFLLRLALTIPLLLISGWLVAKKRNSKYWPIYRGFIFFALFAFFVELVPYLPSYGGYIRYAGGIVISLMMAHVLLKWRERYLKTKESEQNKSDRDKRNQIKHETGIKKIASGVCPSCDRSYYGNKKTSEKDKEFDFCVHCGFSLFKNCTNCGTRANSFYKFCGSCGTSSNTEATKALA